jgi:hypothetical protein
LSDVQTSHVSRKLSEVRVIYRECDERAHIEDSLRNGDFEMYHDYLGREIEDAEWDAMWEDAREVSRRMRLKNWLYRRRLRFTNWIADHSFGLIKHYWFY